MEEQLLAKTESIALVGTLASLVEVEVHVTTGVPKFTIVGLPAKSVQEAEERTRSALASTDYRWPPARIVANLAPGALRKEGTHFDLPIAVGIIAGDGRADRSALQGWILIGELALDGSVRPVRGALAAAIACRDAGRRGLICPAANAPEAALVAGIEVIPITKLEHCVAFLAGDWLPGPVEAIEIDSQQAGDDMRDVRGHASAKRAAEIAAAGGHNLLLSGPPGSGKTMLACRLPAIFPPISTEESLEVTRIYSVAGLLPERAGLVRTRPFRAPHHHISLSGLIGGGTGLARPGEISLAHYGVLFLDEVALFKPEVLEGLRGPLEDGVVRIARSGGVVIYPCRFALAAAMNPCPCGYLGDPARPCRCSERQLASYRTRLSGPLIDRFDVHVSIERLGKAELLGRPRGDSSETIRSRVAHAREMQAQRYLAATTTNASACKSELDNVVRLASAARETLGQAIDSLTLSGRGVDRVLRTARTIADLQQEEEVSDAHVAEALQLRAPHAARGWAA
jgi:magnesium chelatase family protein